MATVGGVMVAAQRSAVQRSAVQRTGGPAVRLVAAGRTGSSAIHSQGMAPCPPLPTVSFGAISLDAAAVAAVSCARGTGAFSLRSAPLSLVSHTAAAPAGTEVPVRQWGRYGRASGSQWWIRAGVKRAYGVHRGPAQHKWRPFRPLPARRRKNRSPRQTLALPPGAPNIIHSPTLYSPPRVLQLVGPKTLVASRSMTRSRRWLWLNSTWQKV